MSESDAVGAGEFIDWQAAEIERLQARVEALEELIVTWLETDMLNPPEQKLYRECEAALRTTKN